MCVSSLRTIKNAIAVELLSLTIDHKTMKELAIDNKQDNKARMHTYLNAPQAFARRMSLAIGPRWVRKLSCLVTRCLLKVMPYEVLTKIPEYPA